MDNTEKQKDTEVQTKDIDSWLEPSKYLKQEHQVVRSIVRRLTPKECCRLMFVPEDHPFVDGDATSDSSVYKAQGNGWARNQSRWVFKRQHEVDEKFVTGHRKPFKFGTISSGQGTHELSVTDFGDISLFASEIDPFPCRILAERFPETVNFGDMTRIDFDPEKGVVHNRVYEGYQPMSKDTLGFQPYEAPYAEIPLKYGEIDVISGGTPCFVAGSMVLTDKGYKPIEEIKVGDLVLTHKGRLQPVEKVGSKLTDSTYILRTENFHEVRVTGNHPFLVTGKTGEVTPDNERCVKVEDLSVGKNNDQRLVVISSFSPYGEKWGMDTLIRKDFIQFPVVVYNIQVAEDHTYVCNGFCVHNCTDLSVAGKRSGGMEGSGTRSALSFQLQRIGKALGSRWLVWENVCFGADTLVTTDNGHRRIADIKVGDKVRSSDGKFHAVEKVFVTKDKDTIRLSVMGAEPIEVTPNHPFYARVKKPLDFKVGKREFDKPVWIPAGELTKNHYIGYKLDAVGTKSIGMANAYAVGRWLADGSVALRSENSHSGVRGGQRARIFISTGWKKHDALLAELSRLPYPIRESKIKDYAINFTFTSDDFYELIKDCGKGAWNKKVPEYAYSLKPEEQAELLRGYFDGDGHLHKQCEMTYSSSSRELAMGMARLIRDVYHRGVSLRKIKMPEKVVIEGRTVKSHDAWAGSFSNEIIYSGEKKHLKSFVEDGIVWCPVRSVEDGQKQTVYNLCVETTHTYEANDVMVHNCGAISSNGGKDFGWFLYRVMQAGYTIAWRTLDAQVTFCDMAPRAVPQRRMRIWMVAYRGEDWRIPCRVLFEPMKVLGTEPPRRIVGRGFLNADPTFNPDEAEFLDVYKKKKGADDGARGDLFSMFFGEPEPDDYAHYKPRKLTRAEVEVNFPEEADIRKVKPAEMVRFMRTVGFADKAMYAGPLFAGDKDGRNGEVTPDDLAKGFLENLGTGGIISQGFAATLKMPTWNAGLTEEELAEMDEFLRELYDGTVCGLSDVLYRDVDGKYRLSWRACWGILVRAETRGKKLPELLEDALLWQIAWNPEHVKWAMLNAKNEEERGKAADCWKRVIEPNAALFNCPLDEIVPESPKKAEDDSAEDDEDDGDDADSEEAADEIIDRFCEDEAAEEVTGDEA